MDSRSLKLREKKKVLKLFFVKTQIGKYHQKIIFIILFFEIIEGSFSFFFGLRLHEGFVV